MFPAGVLAASDTWAALRAVVDQRSTLRIDTGAGGDRTRQHFFTFS